MKKFSLLFKLATLVGLTILMLIPVTMIMDMIDERHDYQLSVINNISNSSGGEQTIIGPIIVQPYIQQHKVVEGKKVTIHEQRYFKYILPEQLTINASLQVEKRYIGIYHAKVYKGGIDFEGQLPALDMSELAKKEGIKLQKPYAVVLVPDTRGIMSLSSLSLQREEQQTKTADKQQHEVAIDFVAGTADSRFQRGIHAPLPDSITSSKTPVSFKFTMNLQGSQSLSVIPLGKVSSFNLSANWPHPNFLGHYLPVNKTIDEKGFTATWQSSWFANNINDIFSRYEYEDGYSEMSSLYSLPSFDVKLMELVDEYRLNERSVKYSVLFIGLTFIGFFLFEIMKSLPIHPIQYLLVGVALALFYLILLALSEHIGFELAYFIAALACSALITFYLMAVLKGVMRGLSFGFAILALYAVLFALLQSENNSLLLGSGLLFVVVAAIMMLTRKFDWYNFSPAVATTKAQHSGVSLSEENTHHEISEELARKDCRLWK